MAATLNTVTQQVREVAATSRETSHAAEALAALVAQLHAETDRLGKVTEETRTTAQQLASVAGSFRRLDEESRDTVNQQPREIAELPVR